jgi:hypothetical protein
MLFWYTVLYYSIVSLLLIIYDCLQNHEQRCQMAVVTAADLLVVVLQSRIAVKLAGEELILFWLQSVG